MRRYFISAKPLFYPCDLCNSLPHPSLMDPAFFCRNVPVNNYHVGLMKAGQSRDFEALIVPNVPVEINIAFAKWYRFSRLKPIVTWVVRCPI